MIFHLFVISIVGIGAALFDKANAITGAHAAFGAVSLIGLLLSAVAKEGGR